MSDENQETADTSAPTEKTYSEAEYGALKEAHQTMQGRLADMEARFKGVDLDAISREREELAELRKNKAQESPEDLDAWKEQETQRIESIYKEKLEAAETSVESLTRERKELRVTNAAMSKMSESFTEDGRMLLKPLIERHADYENDTIVIKDNDGEVRRSKSKPSENMSLDEFIEELKEGYPSTVKSKFRSGDKMPAETGGRAGRSSGQGLDAYVNMSNEERKKNFSPRERQRFAREMTKMRKSGELNA